MADDSVRRVSTFELFKRAFHVFSEAKRVYDFKQVCDTAASSGDDSGTGDALKRLGKLMYESHDSCAKNYDCSHPALDEMVQLSNMYGALGARVSETRTVEFFKISAHKLKYQLFQLTGAGWGGCIVALVPNDNVKEYVNGLKTKYYSKLNPDMNFEAMDQLIFPTEPGSGALIFKLQTKGEL